MAVVLVVCLYRPTPDPVVLVVKPADSVTVLSAGGTKEYPRRRNPCRQGVRQSGSRTWKEFSATVPTVETREKTLVMELNGADTLTLQLLHGIGPTFARRIVRYRERLGGFCRVEQLREVYGMTDDRYQALVPHLTVDVDSIRRIDINKVTVKELMRHPYIDPYLARDIIRYRERGHRYRAADDLRLVATMDDSTLMRLTPYLRFE